MTWAVPGEREAIMVSSLDSRRWLGLSASCLVASARPVHAGTGVQVGLCSVTANATPVAGHWLYLNPNLDVAAVAWQFLSQFTLPAMQ